MRFLLCEKHFLLLNTDADAVNTKKSMPIFPSGQREHDSFIYLFKVG